MARSGLGSPLNIPQLVHDWACIKALSALAGRLSLPNTPRAVIWQ